MIVVDRVALAAGDRGPRRRHRNRRHRVALRRQRRRWVELVAGAARDSWTDGQLVTCADRDGARRLLVDGEPVTPADLQVRSVVAADRGGIVFIANPIDDATVSHVWRYARRLGSPALTDEPGVHTAAAAGGTVVIRTATLEEPRASWDTLDGVELQSFAATPNLALNASIHFLGSRRLATTVLLPSDHDGSPLPVLLDPYGGPTRCARCARTCAHLSSQWFADQGFAVVVTDGRGTPGTGQRLGASDPRRPRLGCASRTRSTPSSRPPPSSGASTSIGSPSAAGASAAISPRSPCLLRPDRFHAAIAGAPVTEWRLYDTHYTERYLGDPNAEPIVYDGSSLLPLAGELHPAAAADPRARRRQRPCRPHPAAVLATARRRPAARGAPAGRRHPHDAPGGRRREPAAPPARLPAPIARSRQLTLKPRSASD